jgi:hypothetical protein
MEEIDVLIAGRPRAYTWLGFQRVLLWTFLSLGIILFFNTVYMVASGIAEYLYIEKASQEIAKIYQLNKKEVEEILIRYFDPIKYKSYLYSFFLSLSFFIIARYAQKVINRNQYIILLEKEWMKRKGRV